MMRLIFRSSSENNKNDVKIINLNIQNIDFYTFCNLSYIKDGARNNIYYNVAS